MRRLSPVNVCLLNSDACRPSPIDILARFLKPQHTGIADGGFENIDGRQSPIAPRFPSIFGELDDGLESDFDSRSCDARSRLGA
jgi:hypothetical protein